MWAFTRPNENMLLVVLCIQLKTLNALNIHVRIEIYTKDFLSSRWEAELFVLLVWTSSVSKFLGTLRFKSCYLSTYFRLKIHFKKISDPRKSWKHPEYIYIFQEVRSHFKFRTQWQASHACKDIGTCR